MYIETANLIETQIFIVVHPGLCDSEEFGKRVTAEQETLGHLEFTSGLEAIDRKFEIDMKGSVHSLQF